jgi:Fic family protein
MALYWPGFDFSYTLNFQRLLPHIAAIEAYRESAANRILPPGWREKSLDGDDFLANLSAEEQSEMDAITRRKYELLITNAGNTQAWVRQRFNPGSAPLSLEDIFAMHRMAADESGLRYKGCGALRASPVVVGRSEVGGIHAGAPAEKLPRLMDQYVRLIGGNEWATLPPVIHSLLAHFFFTTIHPFADGNGRLCRLISAAILFQRGYCGHGFYAFSRYFYHNNARYHTLLHQCWQQPLPFDLTAFVAFGMEGFIIELQDIKMFMKIKLRRSLSEELVPTFRKRLEWRRSRIRAVRFYPERGEGAAGAAVAANVD